MVITSQDGSAIANMVGGAIIEIENLYEHCSIYFRISDYEVLLGRFHTFAGAREWMERIESAYLRGDSRFKVGCEEERPMPEEKWEPDATTSYYGGYVDGWNSCLDAKGGGKC